MKPSPALTSDPEILNNHIPLIDKKLLKPPNYAILADGCSLGSGFSAKSKTKSNYVYEDEEEMDENERVLFLLVTTSKHHAHSQPPSDVPPQKTISRPIDDFDPHNL